MKAVVNNHLRHMAIATVLNAISFLRLYKIFRIAAGRGVIFTLHHVRPFVDRGFNPNALLEITPEFLEQAILVAKRAGLEPVRLEGLPQLLAEPNSKRKFVCFTLDDGNCDNAEYAAPIFRKYNVPYTIFICPGLTTRKTTMWWETVAAVLGKVSSVQFDFGAGAETLRNNLTTYLKFARYVQMEQEDKAVARVNALAQSVDVDPHAIVEHEIMSEVELKTLCADPLLSFGAHSMTHRNLARLSPAELDDEIVQSCKAVSAYAGKPVTSFAYPYGWSTAAGPREFVAAENAGVVVAVTTQPGVLQSSDLNSMTGLRRVSLNGLYQHPRYVRALISGIAFWLT